MFVPEDRIKRIEAYAPYEGEEEEKHVLAFLYESIGREIAAKLKEFNKHRLIKVEEASSYHVYIDVIVPK
jgi:hypothetical protein